MNNSSISISSNFLISKSNIKMKALDTTATRNKTTSPNISKTSLFCYIKNIFCLFMKMPYLLPASGALEKQLIILVKVAMRAIAIRMKRLFQGMITVFVGLLRI
jgi:hypothetical protein